MKDWQKSNENNHFNIKIEPNLQKNQNVNEKNEKPHFSDNYDNSLVREFE